MRSYLKAYAILVAGGFLLAGCGMRAAYEPKNRVVEGDVLLRVYVVRHGEAYRNVPHPADMPEQKLDSLTPKGLTQAASAGKFLKGKSVAAVIASPTGRTRQTAQPICEALGLQEGYAQDAAFASLKAGKTPDGEPVSWAWRQEQWKAGRDPRPAGGESLADGATRAVNAIGQLAKKYPGGSVVIVSHGEICAALLGRAEDTPMCERYELHDVPTGSVSEIVITDAGWYLLKQGVTRAEKE
jgi:probable phosphoglycerate mutase